MAERKTIRPAKPRGRPKVGTPKPPPTGNNGDSFPMTEQSLMVLSATASAAVQARLGVTYGGDRNVYDALGYNKEPTFDDFMAKYRRQDLATAIIDKPVQACWRKPPVLTESADDETPFETEWAELVKRLNMWGYLRRVDRLCRIGSYSVLLIGFQDGAELKEEVTNGRDVMYLMPYAQRNVEIYKTVEDTQDIRYGKPLIYRIKMLAAGGSKQKMDVHWSRVIHVAENLLEDESQAIPALASVYNRLDNLELIAGGSAEMFWRGAFQGLAALAREGFTFTQQDKDELRTELENYWHGLSRILRLKGMDVEQLGPQIADPKDHASVQYDLIAASTGIPKRMLIGSERGEMSSAQDKQEFNDRMESRQLEHCEGNIVRPLADRLILTKVLTEPKEGYECEWPPLSVPTVKDEAEVGELRANAIKVYAESLAFGGAELMPVRMAMEKILHMRPDEIEQAEEMAAEMQQDERGMAYEGAGAEEEE